MNLIYLNKAESKTNYIMHSLHSHPYYEFFFLTKGERRIFSLNRLYTVSAMTMLILPPHEMHKMEGGAYERYTVCAHPLFLDETEMDIIKSLSSTAISIPKEQQDFVLSLLNDLIEVQENEYTTEEEKTYLFRSLFNTLLYIVTKKYSRNEPQKINNEMPPLLNKILSYLGEHFGEKIVLDDLADEFFVSKSTILYNFKKHLQCSPMDYLLSIRLINAKKYLLDKKKRSITTISELCGFSSSNYFTEIFKSKEGLSPTAYRKFHVPTIH